MKTYFADTNFYLRFLLNDNKDQAEKSASYLKKAKQQEIKIVFLSEVILEMGIVLEKFYKLKKPEIARHFSILIKTAYLAIEDRSVWGESFAIFSKKNIDLLDVFLFVRAKTKGAEVLSYDKDFVRLAREFNEVNS